MSVRFLSGSSGVNGTLCIRGTPTDYDDWNLDGWSGEQVFRYMCKVSECSLGSTHSQYSYNL